MRLEDIYIAGTGTALGELRSIDEAVTAGEYPIDLAEDDGYVSVSVCEDVAAIELAEAAAQQALDRAALGTHADLLLHACVGFQGLDDFASAAYLHHRLLEGDGVPSEVRQASNGGLAALELGAAFLAARTDPAYALLATSDVFAPPMYARYGTPGTLYGDAGTALVLSNRPQRLQLRSIVSASDTTHEPLQRAGVSWICHAGQSGWPIDVASRVATYVEERGPEAMIDLVSRIRATERSTIDRALSDAGITTDQVTAWIFPNMGLTLTDWDARTAAGVAVERSTWEWGRTVGHLGAGDQFAALDHIEGRLSPGDHVVINGSGTGFTFTSVVVTVVEAEV
ncbi:ketoacyl-ACP synthase III family protein [Nocardia sp. CNY236]|uniref:ketoacyl-ACP synthase III family protein n=1 Tax=Nocardia sp. CNY236 TaxID=1169152 RepID=UPI0003FFAEC9|nr:ketoacyl-ACP synthase III family protein [Nocardia sp. CNY236]